MADQKISQLTSATTPLAGTEVLPIVQSGSTVKVANNDLRPKQIQSNATSGVLQIAGPATASTRVMTTPDANFTAARTDAAQSFTGDQTLSTGNLVQGTAAKGINFTANSAAAGMTSQLLNYYEEGTWTPTVKVNNTGSAIGITLYEGTYTRVGRLVFAEFRIARNDASALSGTVTWSLPISSGNSTYFVSGSWWNASTNISGTVDINNYAASIANGGIAAGGYLTYANFANGDNLCVSMIYQA